MNFLISLATAGRGPPGRMFDDRWKVIFNTTSGGLKSHV